MRILHAIRSVNPRGGGPIEGIKQLSQINESNGHHVEVVSLDGPTDAGVKEFPFTLAAVGPVGTKYGYTSRFVPWIRRHHSRFDVLIVNGLWQFNALGVRLGLRDTATPYCVYPHGMLDPWFRRRYPLKHLKKWLYWPWGDYRVLRDARAVFFTCEEERRLARLSFWLYRCREVVVNYGTAPPPPRAEAQQALFYETFPLLRGKRLVLFLGRLHEKKGADLLLRAFRVVQQEAADRPGNVPLHLVMVGPDANGYQKHLQELSNALGINNAITWAGMLSGDLKWGAFRAAEVFVLPSHQENFGIAVVEALACGVPVLISNQVNIWREIVDDKAGLAAADDLAGTLSLLRQWLQLGTAEQERWRECARQSFEQRFHMERVAENLIHTLRQLGVNG
jgi:glycosyltransferase involved in cell wall biosynthesis